MVRPSCFKSGENVTVLSVRVGGADTGCDLLKGDPMNRSSYAKTAATVRNNQAPEQGRPDPSGQGTTKFDVRIADIKALSDDGRIVSEQHRVPNRSEFNQVFSAFAQGTLLHSKQGFIAIEDLLPGDWLNTAEGTFEQITWIGSMLFTPSEHDTQVSLTRIMADSFGMNRPESFVCLGPAARVLQTPPDMRGSASPQQMLTPAIRFLDGVNVIETTPPTTIRLFHLALRNHGAVIASGLQVESFHPGVNPVTTLSYTLRKTYASLFPNVRNLNGFGEIQYPRVPD